MCARLSVVPASLLNSRERSIGWPLGEPWCVQIVGEPGIGKSRLLVELCRRGEDRGYLVLNGRAAEFERDIPFGLIVDALNDYFGSLEPARASRARRRRAARAGRDLPGAAARPTDGRRAGARAPSATGCTTRSGACSSGWPRASRWCSRSTTSTGPTPPRSRCSRICCGGSAGPLLMAVAYRQAPSRLLAALEGAARGGPSGAGSSSRCSRPRRPSALIGADVDDTTRATLYRESGGNPFYIEQLVRTGHPHRIRPRRGARALARGGAARGARRDPRGGGRDLRRVALRARGGRGRGRVVRARAGRRRSPSRAVPSVLAAIDELLEFDFIRPTEMPRRFRFRHPIVRRAVYDGIPQGWQIGAHARGRGGAGGGARSGRRARPSRRELGRRSATSRRSRCSCRRAATPRRARPRRPDGGCWRPPGCLPPSRTATSGGCRCSARRRPR